MIKVHSIFKENEDTSYFIYADNASSFSQLLLNKLSVLRGFTYGVHNFLF